MSHDVFCRLKKQHGCPWKGPLCELKNHLKECAFVDVNCVKNCGKQMKKKDLEQHLEKECPNRTLPCDYCKEEIIWNGLESHYETCPTYPLPCLTCGKENIPRNMMEEHLGDECPETEIKCPFNTVGCKFMCPRGVVDEHVREQQTTHMMYILRAFADLKAAQNGMEARIKGQADREKQELRRRNASLASEVDHLKRRQEEMREMMEMCLPGMTLTNGSGVTPSYIG